MKILAAFVFAAAAGVALPATAEIFKCPGPDGKTVFQDSPCDGSVKRSVTPPDAKTDGRALDGLAGLSRDDSEIAMLLLFYQHCTRIFPDLHAKSAMSYQAWRIKNAQAVSRIEASSAYRTSVERAREEAAKNLEKPGLRAEARGQCDQLVTGAFTPPPTNVARTPQEAWSGFMAAVAGGDAEKALGYLMPGSRGRYSEVFRSLGPDGMRNAAATFGELKGEQRIDGDLAFGYLTRKGPDGKLNAFEISFMRDRRSGGWFIESM